MNGEMVRYSASDGPLKAGSAIHIAWARLTLGMYAGWLLHFIRPERTSF